MHPDACCTGFMVLDFGQIPFWGIGVFPSGHISDLGPLKTKYKAMAPPMIIIAAMNMNQYVFFDNAISELEYDRF